MNLVLHTLGGKYREQQIVQRDTAPTKIASNYYLRLMHEILARPDLCRLIRGGGGEALYTIQLYCYGQ